MESSSTTSRNVNVITKLIRRVYQARCPRRRSNYGQRVSVGCAGSQRPHLSKIAAITASFSGAKALTLIFEFETTYRAMMVSLLELCERQNLLHRHPCEQHEHLIANFGGREGILCILA